MAMCDYYLCDSCGGKAFYDADIRDPSYTSLYDGDDESAGTVSMKVLCPDCSLALEVVVRRKAEPDELDRLREEVAHLRKVEKVDDADIDRLWALLAEVRDKGLIYWEPNTDRGHERKADMLARIERALPQSLRQGAGVAPTGDQCPVCDGNGSLSEDGSPGGDLFVCHTCEGSGTLLAPTAGWITEAGAETRDLRFLDGWIDDWLSKMHADITDEERGKIAEEMCSDWYGAGVGASIRDTLAGEVDGGPQPPTSASAFCRFCGAEESGPRCVNCNAVAESEAFLLIRGGYFYRPGARGYTASRAEAGHFTEAEAMAHAQTEGVTARRASECEEVAQAELREHEGGR